MLPSVRLWQPVLLVTLDDTDTLWAVHAFHRFETLRGDLAGARDELDDLREMLLVVRLQYFPEPPDNVVGGGIA